MGLTLWLVPNETEAQKLEAIMAIRPQAGTLINTSEASYPRFDPHVTLAALPRDPEPTLEGIQLALPVLSAPLNVVFDSIEIGDHYFRSVYAAVRPSPDLLALHGHIHQHLNISSPRTPKFPHLSLCYITDDHAATGERTRYYDALSTRTRTVDDRVRIDCSRDKPAEEAQDWLAGLQMVEIWVVRCDGPVETWVIEKKIPLQIES
ncbi:Cyclic phosphodiesterase [Mycena indigotica]|uniref:Cyclic phosphodiesterase n=1 Tax=Mycena indigotica TaxID=2126181 RepID=A0A8H6S9H1_9AGAR|nr:Cyclic phosphodiesterase [Mycena indigotica]KAF7295460.1 Cyclic phosphodiesterase [Mycena indigotica]